MSGSQRRVRVDPRLCEGHALCIDLAPEVFDLSADDVASCDERPADALWDDALWDDALWDTVKAAVDACPRGAIAIESQ